MKTIIIFFFWGCTFTFQSLSQNTEHLDVQEDSIKWKLTMSSDYKELGGVNSCWTDQQGYVRNLIKNALNSLPEEIKQYILQHKMYLSFVFNSKGIILFGDIFIIKEDHAILNEELCLKIYRTIKNIQIDMTKIEIEDKFEWGSFMYNVIGLLKEPRT